nr:hypothetical protein [Tanacetum cinerariifolium]
MFLVYGGNLEAKLRVKSYYNTESQTDRVDTKSQIGFVFILNRGTVARKSWKQSTTAMFGIVPTNIEPMEMYSDNSGAIIIANKLGVQRGSKHYPRRYHYIHECTELGEIILLKVLTHDTLVDPFTKSLPNGKLTQHVMGTGLCLASSFM